MNRPTARSQNRHDLLESYHILDTPPEAVFDRLAQLAADICETPVAAITFADEQRQWSKSVIGIELRDEQLHIPFSIRGMRAGHAFAISDTSLDPLYRGHPLVAGKERIRFYCGIPLASQDAAIIGMLEVMDRVPRTLSRSQLALLGAVAQQVMLQLDSRRKHIELAKATEQYKQSNAALMRRARHLEVAQQIATTGSWEWEIGRDQLMWSDEIYRIFGVAPVDFHGNADAFFAMVHLDDLQPLREALDATLRGTKPLDLEHRIVRPDGEIRHVHERAELLAGPGTRRTLAGTVQDVTARRRSQEHLYLLDACIARLSEGVMITEASPHDEPGLRIVFVNDALERMTGYRRDELLGRSPRILQGPKTQGAELERIRLALKKREAVSAEMINYRKEGKPFWIETDIAPVTDNAGRVTHFVAIQRDISERRRKAEEFAQASRALQMLTRCNDALAKTESEGALLERICHIAVDVGGYRIAWVGYARNDEARSVERMAHAGELGGMAEFAGMEASWSETRSTGQGPTGRAIRSGKAVVAHDIGSDPAFAAWHELIRQHGYASVISLPLNDQHQRTFGALVLVSAETRTAAGEEIRLLQELADNLAFGIRHLRTQEIRRRVEAAVLKLAAAVSDSAGSEFFDQLARNMVEVLGADSAFVARLGTPESRTLQTISVVRDGKAAPNFHCSLEGTALESFLRESECVVAGDAAGQLPAAHPLAAFGGRTFVGCRLDDRSGRPAGLLCAVFREPAAQLEFITSTIRIFTARAAHEMERQEADAQIREQALLLDKAHDAIVACGPDYRITQWNSGAELLYGWTRNEAMGKFKRTLLYAEPAEFDRAAAAVVSQREWRAEVTKRRKNGATVKTETHWTWVSDDQGNLRSILEIDRDLTERKAAEQEIERLAFYDQLTGLPNRRLLLDRLQHALAAARRNRQFGALLFIDLDNFKTLNDTRGHDKGDLLLQQVARRLETCVPRKSDSVARLGGDEFVVMLEDLSDNEAGAAAHAEAAGEKILAELNLPYQLGDFEHHSTPSIGIALLDKRISDIDELLKRADMAMYQAKAAGRNAIRFFDPDMQTVIDARVALESDFRRALQQHELLLLYQPLMDEAGRVVGLEALSRWQHAVRGAVAPAVFIPLAEESGLIMRFAQWVLEAACEQLVQWTARPEMRHLSVAVNVSLRQFRHPAFVEQVLGVLERTGARPENLRLELTESMLLHNPEETRSKMSELGERGIGFSLDDFGTGYSSLSTLKRLPLAQIKIDRSFVQDLLTNANDAAIARTIVAVGDSLGLEVVAEGVETTEQRDFLAHYGCRAFQGYLFGQPLRAEQV
jgi:diguanylate cyclase (GGDEF)-like protein/PAS domain S-box-containing protein